MSDRRDMDTAGAAGLILGAAAGAGFVASKKIGEREAADGKED